MLSHAPTIPLPENIVARFLVLYLLTLACETPVLLVGLSARHSMRNRLFAAIWLNACSYPVVFFVLPEFFPGPEDELRYLVVAEIFAPVSECLLSWAAFIRGLPKDCRATLRDMVVVVLANLTSFGVGEILEPFWKVGT